MVMAAGLGTRLRPLTDFLPKPMMPVANRPVLHHLLNLLHRHDVREVGINLHAFPEMIQTYFGDGSSLDMDIRWSEERELLGTAGGTKKLEEFLGGETILITSGDGLHDVDVTASSATTAGRVRLRPCREAGSDPSSYGVVILDRDTRVRGFQEKPTVTRLAQISRIAASTSSSPNCWSGSRPTRSRFRPDSGRPRRRRRTGLRIHDDGVLERRRRPRRASQRDPRRGARPRRIDIPGEELAPGSGPSRLPHRGRRRSTGRSFSAGA